MNATSKQIRAACYCRISSDQKDKREGTQRQREDTTALCELKGWQIVDFYVDDDRSACQRLPPFVRYTRSFPSGGQRKPSEVSGST